MSLREREQILQKLVKDQEKAVEGLKKGCSIQQLAFKAGLGDHSWHNKGGVG